MTATTTATPTAIAIAEILTAIEARTPGALGYYPSPVLSVMWGQVDGSVRIHCADRLVALDVVSALAPLRGDWTHTEMATDGRYPRRYSWTADVLGLPVRVFALDGDQS